MGPAKNIGASIRKRVEPCNNLVEFADAVKEGFGPRRQNEIAPAVFGGIDSGFNARDRERIILDDRLCLVAR